MTQTNGRTVIAQGRIVWAAGDLFKGQKMLDKNTRQPRLNKAGEQMVEYGFGLAIPKTFFTPEHMKQGGLGEIWVAIHEEAYSLFPTRQIPPGFAMKYKDGDSAIDEKGVPYAQREGYAGHMVFACKTTIPIQYFIYDPASKQNIRVDQGIKVGYHVNVQLTIKAHPAINGGKAGLYINPMAVQLVRQDKEIISAPSGDQIFGTQMPPGFDPTPYAQAPGMLVPPAQVAAPVAPMPMAQPQAVPAPNYNVLPPQHQPVAQAPQMPMPQAAVPQQPMMPPPMPQAQAAPVGFPPIPGQH